MAVSSEVAVDLGVSKAGAHSFRDQAGKNLRQVLSFMEEMEAQASKPKSKNLFFGVVVAPDDVAQGLELSPKEKSIKLRRVRVADSCPLGIQSSYLPLRLSPKLTALLTPNFSLSRLAGHFGGIQMVLGDEKVGRH